MKCKCDNCGFVCEAGELRGIRHLEQRLDHPVDHPDCVMPDGECPKCGALSYDVGGADEGSNISADVVAA